MTKIISSRQSGMPAAGVPRRNWPLRPIQFFKQRSIKRTMVKSPSDGISQPEFRNLLGGRSLATRAVRRIHQVPQTPPASNAGTTTVRPARNRVKRR